MIKLIQYVIHSFRIISSPKQKKKAAWGLFFSSVQAVSDVIGLAAIVPVLMLAIDGNFLEKSSKLRVIYRFFNFNSEGQFLISLIILVLLFFIVKNIFAIWVQYYVKQNAAEVVARATKIKYQQFILKEYQEIVDKGTPDFINLVMNIPYHYATGMLLPFMNFFSEALIILLFCSFILYNPLVFFVVILVLTPAIYIINKSIKNQIVNLGKVSGELREEVLNELNLGINGITEIKINKVSGYFIHKFVKKQLAYAKNEMKSLTVQTIPSRLLEIVALLAVVILVIYGFFYSTNPSEVRILGALFVISIFRLIPAVNRVMVSMMNIKIYKYTADELLKSAQNQKEKSNPIAFTKEIKLKNIVYQYPGSDFPLIKNINLALKTGEVVGLTGDSGSGKSTIVKILLQLLKQKSGDIVIDGKVLTEKSELTWQQMIGYVGQQPYVLNGTIKENVGLAEEDADDEVIKNALSMAGLKEYATEKMIRYKVGENGAKLSEGQKHRLALARVIYKGQKIIILDETTSALDDKTEDRVMNTLKNLAENQFCLLIIAHRKNVLDNCHRVYTLQNKELKET